MLGRSLAAAAAVHPGMLSERRWAGLILALQREQPLNCMKHSCLPRLEPRLAFQCRCLQAAALQCPHRLRMKYIIMAISRLMARYLVACTLDLSYILTATRRLPNLGHRAA